MKDIIPKAKIKIGSLRWQKIYSALKIDKGDCYLEHTRNSFKSTTIPMTPRENGQSI